MGGADAIVFTGGIGENSPEVRARICQGLEWAGLKLECKSNDRTVGLEGQISTDDSSLHALVIPTDEELLIARDTVNCVLGETHPLEGQKGWDVALQAGDPILERHTSRGHGA